MNEIGMIREKLIEAREEKEQLNRRVKLLEAEAKRIKDSDNGNLLGPNYIEKVISLLSKGNSFSLFAIVFHSCSTFMENTCERIADARL